MLVIDIDPQGNASTALGIDHDPGLWYSKNWLLSI